MDAKKRKTKTTEQVNSAMLVCNWINKFDTTRVEDDTEIINFKNAPNVTDGFGNETLSKSPTHAKLNRNLKRNISIAMKNSNVSPRSSYRALDVSPSGFLSVGVDISPNLSPKARLVPMSKSVVASPRIQSFRNKAFKNIVVEKMDN